MESLSGFVYVVPNDVFVSEIDRKGYKEVKAQSKLEIQQPWKAERFYMSRHFELKMFLRYAVKSITSVHTST